MRELGKFTIKSRQIKIRSINDKINLVFFSDVHAGCKAHDAKSWLEFLDRQKNKDQKNTYYFGVGDYFDFAGISEIKKINEKNLRESTIAKIEEGIERDIRKFASQISFMKDHLLGLIDGNHTWFFSNSKSDTEDLAERLNTEALGWMCHYTIQFDICGNKTSVIVLLAHGKAGGKTAGITINQVDDMRKIFPAADIYVFGHDHQRGAWPKSVLLPHPNDSTKIKQKRQFLCRSGAFRKTYEKDEASYEIRALHQPSDLGGLEMTIEFKRSTIENKKREFRTEIRAEI